MGLIEGKCKKEMAHYNIVAHYPKIKTRYVFGGFYGGQSGTSLLYC